MNPRVPILNARFDVLTLNQTVDAVFAMLRAPARGWLCTVNVAMLMHMREDRALQAYTDRAALVVADGQPLVWCARMFGGRLPERVAGIDLIDSLCRRAAAEGMGVYLLGSTSALLQKALGELRRRHPALQVDGADGYFDIGSAAGSARADAVRASGARLLLVGMGSPRQETFIAAHWDRLGVGMAIGVGGSFDVLAGARRRAHPWLRRAGLEWLVRLVQEPRRLLPRYLHSNTRFCWLLVEAVLGRAKRRNWTM
jgi:N-acetylglucosaminyldiphosphoundecaprenol N-acetyl-beta-D-mannosaminyltransferase